MTKTSQPAFLWFRSDNRQSASQNPKWLGLLIIALVLVVGGAVAQAQSPKIPRIGYLTVADSSRPYQAFLQGLHDLGYVEGRNIAIEYRSADGKRERVPGLAAELVRLKVDIIVTDGIGPSQDAKKATSTIPIVMTSSGDPVGIGLIASLSRPGGNVTGLTSFSAGLGGKLLELLKEVVPRLARVAIPMPASTVNDLLYKRRKLPPGRWAFS